MRDLDRLVDAKTRHDYAKLLHTIMLQSVLRDPADSSAMDLRSLSRSFCALVRDNECEGVNQCCDGLG